MESLLTNETIATYTCNDGFSLAGNPNRIYDTGKWTGAEPMCIESISPTLLGHNLKLYLSITVTRITVQCS